MANLFFVLVRPGDSPGARRGSVPNSPVRFMRRPTFRRDRDAVDATGVSLYSLSIATFIVLPAAARRLWQTRHVGGSGGCGKRLLRTRWASSSCSARSSSPTSLNSPSGAASRRSSASSASLRPHARPPRAMAHPTRAALPPLVSSRRVPRATHPPLSVVLLAVSAALLIEASYSTIVLFLFPCWLVSADAVHGLIHIYLQRRERLPGTTDSLYYVSLIPELGMQTCKLFHHVHVWYVHG